MRSIRVHYDDGRSVATSINGSDQEIREYYLNKPFNLGDGFGGDSMATAVRVEFLDPTATMGIKDTIAGIARFHGVEMYDMTDAEAVSWLIDHANDTSNRLAAATYVIDATAFQMANEDAPVRSAFRLAIEQVRELAAEQGHDVDAIMPRN